MDDITKNFKPGRNGFSADPVGYSALAWSRCALFGQVTGSIVIPGGCMRYLVIIVIVLLAPGCATYIPPGAKADLQAFAPPDIQAGFEAKPTNPFPASIAVVRVQSPSYSNHYLNQHGGSYGSGRYSVVLAKELNEDSYLEKVSRLEDVGGIVSINRMLLPERLEGDREIRAAASRLQADMVFLYTFDTAFFD